MNRFIDDSRRIVTGREVSFIFVISDKTIHFAINPNKGGIPARLRNIRMVVFFLGIFSARVVGDWAFPFHRLETINRRVLQ
jgi:hypothetical protein